MQSKNLLLTLLVLIFCLPISAQTFVIDPGHSSVTSKVQRFGAVDVVGRFKDVSGTIQYNADDISAIKANVVISVASYDANNAGGEAAVKSPAFLNANQFPEIKFETLQTKVVDNKNIAVGNLTIHGVTKQVEFPYQIIGPTLDLPTQKQSIAIVADLMVNRQDYGVSFDREMPNGSPFVSNDVKISLNVLAIQE